MTKSGRYIETSRRKPMTVLAIILIALPAAVLAAASAPKEDVHYLLEHLAEAAQDARYFALPWPNDDGGRGDPVIAVGVAEFETRLAGMRGTQLSLGITRLGAGPDAGAAGILEYSGDHTFLSPFVGLTWRRDLGTRLTWLPRMAFGIPLPAGDFNTHLTGPGFDLTTTSTGSKASRIGDMYLMLGTGLRDRRTGVEIDVGSLLTFPLIERLSHEGVDHGLLLSLTWHP